MGIVTAALAPDDSAAGPSVDDFRAAMRNLAGGVTIVTAGTGSERSGLTATSVSSLSATPPSVIACIDCASATLRAIIAHRAFGVNVLAGHHQAIADRFAGRHGISGAARYEGLDWITLVTGTPLLADALAAVDCTLERLVDWHSHMIIIGRVRSVHLNDGESPLVYWRGGYKPTGGSGV